MSAVRHCPGGPDDRATAALRRYRQATGREPPTRLTVACHAGHVLARVVATAEGLVVTGRYTTMTLYRTGANGWPYYWQWQKGQKTSTNPIASIFAWTRGLAHRVKLDGTPEVTSFAEKLEQTCVETVEGGQMTKDLALLIGADAPWLSTDEFMNALDANLSKKLG
jgi:NADP-dependent isocitrate dehydrogenase